MVPEEVAKAVGDSFEWNANEPMQLKGIDQPVRTMALLNPVDASMIDEEK